VQQLTYKHINISVHNYNVSHVKTRKIISPAIKISQYSIYLLIVTLNKMAGRLFEPIDVDAIIINYKAWSSQRGECSEWMLGRIGASVSHTLSEWASFQNLQQQSPTVRWSCNTFYDFTALKRMTGWSAQSFQSQASDWRQVSRLTSHIHTDEGRSNADSEGV